MKAYLLDTCTFLWILTDSPKLSNLAKEIYLDPKNDIYLSVISLWEITVKYQLGKLPLPQPPKELIPVQVQTHAVTWLDLHPSAVYRLADLPSIHADPFDRMLICQAQSLDLTILSPDKHFDKYQVNLSW